MKDFGPEVLKLNPEEETERIAAIIRRQVFQQFRRRGVVLGLSGGIDSSVSVALCVRALGADRVLGLFTPEADSSCDSLRLGRLSAHSLGVEGVLEDITPILEAAGCYRRRDEAIRTLVPEYTAQYKCKIALPGLTRGGGYAVYSVLLRSPEGVESKVRLTAEAYRGIVAATNFKQRTRKMIEYYHADHRHYAVAGTPNRLEYELGFFVKNGDGAADLKPIAHLYKSQVYQLAAYLNVPEEIRRRPPTTDTYSLEQSQEEFYFSVSLEKMDLCLYGKTHGLDPATVAGAVGLTAQQVSWVYGQIDSKRRAGEYLHAPPLLAGKD
jgi:NAD+ synthase